MPNYLPKRLSIALFFNHYGWLVCGQLSIVGGANNAGGAGGGDAATRGEIRRGPLRDYARPEPVVSETEQQFGI